MVAPNAQRSALSRSIGQVLEEGKGLTKEGSDPVDPVGRTKVEGNQIRTKCPGWVEGTTCVVDTRQPVSRQLPYTT